MADTTNVIAPPDASPAPSSIKRRKRKARPDYENIKTKKSRKSRTKATVEKEAAASPSNQDSAGSRLLQVLAQTTPTHQRNTRPVRIINAANTAYKSFGDLPPELRNRIYDLTLALPDNKPIRLTSGTKKMGEQLGLGLLGTCKAVRKEALSYYLQDPVGFRIDIVKLDKNTRREGPLAYFTECYDSRKKTYEKPLSSFLDGVTQTHRLSKFTGLKSIKQITFCYFHAQPDDVEDGAMLPEVADLTITWSFLPKKPYYKLEINEELSMEKSEPHISSAMERIDATVLTMVQERSVREFAVKDVLEVCDKIYYSSLNARIGRENDR